MSTGTPLLAAILVCLGLYGLWKGELTYGPEGGGENDHRSLEGWRARIPASAVLASGLAFPFDATLGCWLFLLAVVLPWFLQPRQ